MNHLNLDGNPVGRTGARALMSALQTRGGSDLDLSLRQCDTSLEDPDLFDSDEPGGDYRLDLSKPYDRMVCVELVQIATLRDHATFDELRYYPSGRRRL